MPLIKPEKTNQPAEENKPAYKVENINDKKVEPKKESSNKKILFNILLVVVYILGLVAALAIVFMEEKCTGS